jgi:hypothetical protein
MKKFWLLSAGLVVLSGSMFADTIGAGTGSLVAVGPTATFLGSQVSWASTGGASPAVPANPTNGQVPFWNNPSEDTINNHVANVGDVLGGVTTGTDLIGGNLSGAPGSGSTVNGSFYASASGNGDPVSTTANAFTGNLTVNGVSATTYSSIVPALEFSFQSQATAYSIALLFADSSQNTGCAVGANCPIVAGSSNGIGTVWGTYTETNTNTGNFTLTPLNDPTNNTTGTASGGIPGGPLAANGSFYGFYATVCYMSTNVGGASTCTYSVTYTSGAGNFSTQTTNTTYLGGLGWNHFALFELASGEEVIGFKDYPWGPGNPNSLESIGDFNDIIIGLNPPGSSSTPEPATIAFMGLGLAGLGLLGRRRFAKK